jgi:hypothetical protein
VELCPRALEVLRRHLVLRDEYVAAGEISHQCLFFLSVFAGAAPTMRGIPR